MACNVAAFQDAIRSRAAEPMFTYLEVGCSRGGTVVGLSRFMESIRPGRWKSVGLDKREGGWEYGYEAFVNECGPLWGGGIQTGTLLDYKAAGLVYFNDDGAEIFMGACRDTFDLILIDACHGKDCVMRDFYMASTLVKPGGYIFFHDADPASQGKDLQPHCQQTIGVRSALADLGLLDSDRPGWQLVFDIRPDTEADRGCVVVKRSDKAPE